MVIYHGRIRKKSPTKQIQGFNETNPANYIGPLENHGSYQRQSLRLTSMLKFAWKKRCLDVF